MYSNKPSVIITGGTSFIGVHLIQEYLNHDWNVIAIVRPNSKNLSRLPKDKRLEIIEEDIKNLKDILPILKDKEINVFYHLAWEGVRAPFRDDESLQYENYQCAINAMRIAKELGCKTFIGAGSQAEYGKCIGEIDENYITKPLTQYGKYKLKAYEELSRLAQVLDIRFIWTRIFSVYGIYDYNGTLVMTVLDKMKKNEEIPLTQCIQQWDYIYVEDAARAMYLLAQKSHTFGIYNIASGKSRELKEFVLEMKQLTNSISELKFGELPYNEEGIVSFKPIVNKLESDLEWKCEFEFKDGIEKIIRYMI